MLATEKITQAFEAICEEAESLKGKGASEEVTEGLSRIISIARHQNDIRKSAKGSCTAQR